MDGKRTIEVSLAITRIYLFLRSEDEYIFIFKNHFYFCDQFIPVSIFLIGY